TTNAVRGQLNGRARQLLIDAGAVGGPEVHAGGARLAVGDWVIARRNDRRIRCAEQPGWFLRNGARGVITRIDTTVGEVVVAFDDGPHVRVPRWYVADGHL